jgi:hypothetical protein
MAGKKRRDKGDRIERVSRETVSDKIGASLVLPSTLEPRVAPNVILQDIVEK